MDIIENMNIKIDCTALEIKNKSGTCKGKIYKLIKNTFISGRGDIVFKDTFVLQKRKSCPGCPQCGWIADDIANAGVEGIVCKTFKEGALYKLEMTNIQKDWETRYVDDYDIELVEVEQ